MKKFIKYIIILFSSFLIFIFVLFLVDSYQEQLEFNRVYNSKADLKYAKSIENKIKNYSNIVKKQENLVINFDNLLEPKKPYKVCFYGPYLRKDIIEKDTKIKWNHSKYWEYNFFNSDGFTSIFIIEEKGNIIPLAIKRNIIDFDPLQGCYDIKNKPLKIKIYKDNYDWITSRIEN